MKPGILAQARHVVLPDGIVSSAFPPVRETCRQIGIRFDLWQQELNRCILAKTEDGLYAADTVVLSIPRQVGKTFDVAALVFGICITNPGTTVVWTAHRFKVSRETFTMLLALAKSPPLKAHLNYDDITTAAGNEAIPFLNGSRIVFAARERGAIRGFTKVRILVLDEAQILTESGLADLTPTMNQAENPLIILMGTPPKPADPSEVFSNLRQLALEGDSEGVLYVEASAKEDADLDDRAAWAEANWSYPSRTPERAILRMRKLLSDDDFAREALGIWGRVNSAGVIPGDLWKLCADPASRVAGQFVIGVEAEADMSDAAVTVAGLNGVGRVHVELAKLFSTDSSGESAITWAGQKVIDIYRRRLVKSVVVDAHGPAAALVPMLKAAGIDPVTLPVSDVARACGGVLDGIVDGSLVHTGLEPRLTMSVLSGRKRLLHNGDQWVWKGGKGSAPVRAMTLAHYGWLTNLRVLNPKRRMVVLGD